MKKTSKKNMASVKEKLKAGGPIENDKFNSNERAQRSCTETRWLTSKEAMQALKIPSCELMHRRERGELVFQKKGNSFLYKIEINDIT